MSITNNGVLIGYMANDPVTKTVRNNLITNFRIGVPSLRKDQNGETITDWLYITAFGKIAENIAKLGAKGRHIALEVMTYDDFSTQGQMFTNIIVNTFEFLDKKVPEHARNAESNYGYNAEQGYGYDPAYYDPNTGAGADTGFDVNDQYALTGQNPRN